LDLRVLLDIAMLVSQESSSEYAQPFDHAAAAYIDDIRKFRSGVRYERGAGTKGTKS
jgi:hypothetical protein